MRSQSASYHGYRFPPDIISHAVWLYHRFCLSLRDAEDLLAQRGVTVTYETIRRHCNVNRVGPQSPAWIPFQAALAVSHTLNASFRNRLNVSLFHK